MQVRRPVHLPACQEGGRTCYHGRGRETEDVRWGARLEVQRLSDERLGAEGEVLEDRLLRGPPAYL